MESFYHNIIIWIDSSKYFLLFIGTIIEGPVVMMASGFLYKLGKFSLLPMYFTLVLGDFTADIIWYSFGRLGTRNAIFKYGHFVGINPYNLEKIEKLFNKYHQKILIISKLTMGFGFAVVILVAAGIFKVPFKKYALLNLLGGFIWTALIISIGFFLGNIYTTISKPMKISFVIVIFTLFILGIKYTNNYLKTKVI